MKILMLLVNVVLWLQVFVVPSAVFGFAAFLLYNKSSENLVYSILLLAAGVILGFLLAEKIRKKHGLLHFFSRLIATPELYARNNLDKGDTKDTSGK